jgi:hypothetical protein
LYAVRKTIFSGGSPHPRADVACNVHIRDIGFGLYLTLGRPAWFQDFVFIEAPALCHSGSLQAFMLVPVRCNHCSGFAQADAALRSNKRQRQSAELADDIVPSCRIIDVGAGVAPL